MQDDSNWIEATLSKMSLEEKAGQMLVVGFWQLPNEQDTILKRIRACHLGGFFHFTLNQADLAQFVEKAQAQAGIPLFVCSDYEAGTGAYLREGTLFPRPMARGSRGSPEMEYAIGKHIATEARALGVNYTLSPVVDVNTNPFCPDVNVRAYGDDPEVVSRLAAAYIRGIQDQGVIATAKHFPGNGSTHMDQHISPAIIDLSRAELERICLRPFREAISAGVGSVMVAHLEVPSLCTERHPVSGRTIPVSMSREVITGLLKKEMGFEGIVISDALNMGGVTSLYSREEANIKAIEAGTDILLNFFPTDFERDVESILRAVDKDVLSLDRIDDAVRRILRAKLRIGLDRGPHRPHPASERERLFRPDRVEELCGKIAGDALTLLKNDKQALPLPNLADKNVVVFNVFCPENKMVKANGGTPLRDITAERLRARGAKVQAIEVVSDWTLPELRERLAVCRNADYVFINFYVVPSFAIGTLIPNLNAVRLFFLGILTEARQVVITSFGDPYVMTYYPTAPTCLFAFDQSKASQEMAVKAWLGEIPIRGRMPVNLKNIYRRGDGLDLI
ncbi:MAG: glycoside hydrolase family 3 protein [Limisphaerales bacterium]